jgi:hypothetical protein
MKQAFRWRVRSDVMMRITGIALDEWRLRLNACSGISTESAQEMQKGGASECERKNRIIRGGVLNKHRRNLYNLCGGAFMAKHMKTSDIKVKIRFVGKRPELHIVIPDKVAKRLYVRLRNRFGNS